VKSAGSLAVAICLLLTASARAQERTERKVREERAADRTRSSLASTDNAAAPQAVGDAERRHDERNEIRLGELPVAHRDDVATSAAQILPGVALTESGVRLRGGAAAGVATFLDGFRLYRLRAPRAIVDRSDVLSSGYGVSLADLSDGAIFLSTDARPGVRVRAEAFRESQDAPPNPEAIEYGNTYELPRHRQLEVLSGAATVPLLRDRLIITAAVNRSSENRQGSIDYTGGRSPDRASSTTTFALAGSARPNPQHRIDGLVMVSRTGAENGDPAGVQLEAQPTREATDVMGGLRWTGHLIPILTVRLQASTEFHQGTLEPKFCRDHIELCDTASPVVVSYPIYRVGANGLERNNAWVSKSEFGGALELQLGGAGPLQHRVSVSSRLQFDKSNDEIATPGNRIDVYDVVPVPASRITTLNPDGTTATESVWTASPIRAQRTMSVVEDQISVGQRLWLRPGVGLLTSSIEGTGGVVLVSDSALVGSLSAGWDVDGRGRTWLRASANHRADPMADGIAARSYNLPLRKTCLWNPSTQSFDDTICTRSGGTALSTVGLPCGPSGVTDDGSPCRSPPGMPGSWEYTAGLRQSLSRASWIDLDGVYRRTTGLTWLSETNRIWNGPKATAGYRNGRAEILQDLSASEQLFRRYVGATVSVGGRVGDLRGVAAYTYSHQDEGVAQLPTAATGTVFYQRADPDERRHQVRLLATYQLLDAVALGLLYTKESGRPSLPNPRQSTNASFEGPRGINPGAYVNDPDDNHIDHEPSIQRLNLQIRARLGQWLPFGADVYADVLNALDAKDTPVDFGGRWTRIGAELRY
jgi:hypothetical protein